MTSESFVAQHAGICLPVIVITAHDDLGSEDIKGFQEVDSGLRPRFTLEKPVPPKKLVEAISTILDVKVNASPLRQQNAERAQIIKMIAKTDSDTLHKIRKLLNQK